MTMPSLELEKVAHPSDGSGVETSLIDVIVVHSCLFRGRVIVSQ